MDKTIVMTGATQGIGRVAAEQILRQSPDNHLIVLARAPSGVQLVGELQHALGGDIGTRVTMVAADLSSLTDLRRALTEVAALLHTGRLPALHALVGNAGIQHTNARTAGPDGYEATFVVNVLANHLLIRALQEHLVVPARVVITVSDTHFGDLRHNLGMVPGPRWKDPRDLARPAAFPRPDTTTAGRTAYSTSKLAAIYEVHAFSRRLPAGIDIVAFNPGLVPGTGLARNAGPVTRFAMRRVMPLLTHTLLATRPALAGKHLADAVLGGINARSGDYIDRDQVDRSSPESYDPVREEELWAVAEEISAAL